MLGGGEDHRRDQQWSKRRSCSCTGSSHALLLPGPCCNGISVRAAAASLDSDDDDAMPSSKRGRTDAADPRFASQADAFKVRNRKVSTAPGHYRPIHTPCDGDTPPTPRRCVSAAQPLVCNGRAWLIVAAAGCTHGQLDLWHELKHPALLGPRPRNRSTRLCDGITGACGVPKPLRYPRCTGYREAQAVNRPLHTNTPRPSNAAVCVVR